MFIVLPIIDFYENVFISIIPEKNRKQKWTTVVFIKKKLFSLKEFVDNFDQKLKRVKWRVLLILSCEQANH